MSFELIVQPSAKLDIVAVDAYYAQYGKADAFITAIDQVFTQIVERPLMYPIVYEDVRPRPHASVSVLGVLHRRARARRGAGRPSPASRSGLETSALTQRFHRGAGWSIARRARVKARAISRVATRAYEKFGNAREPWPTRPPIDGEPRATPAAHRRARALA